MSSNNGMTTYTLPNCTISTLHTTVIYSLGPAGLATDARGFMDIHPQHIELNKGTFTHSFNTLFPEVEVLQHQHHITLTCPCPTPKNRLCEHQAQVLYNILTRNELRIFFDDTLRHQQLRQFATPYGLQHEEHLDIFFQLTYQHKKTITTPRSANLFPITKESISFLQEQLLPKHPPQLPKTEASDNKKMFIVLRLHKHYKHLCIDLYEAPTTQTGKVKNPFTLLNPLEYGWKNTNPAALRFFTGISQFQHNFSVGKWAIDREALKAIVQNPLQFDCFYHDNTISENVSANAIIPVQLQLLRAPITMPVRKQADFYDITGQLTLNEKNYDLSKLEIKLHYFILLPDHQHITTRIPATTLTNTTELPASNSTPNTLHGGNPLLPTPHPNADQNQQPQTNTPATTTNLHAANTLHFVDNFDLLRIIDFFKHQHPIIRIHESNYSAFQQHILAPLEPRLHVAYTNLRTVNLATQKQRSDNQPDRLIYLSDLDNYILINPVFRYGDVEVPVLSKKQVHAVDKEGNPILITRNDAAEAAFIALLLKQHPDFIEQMETDMTSFYLHRKRFLNNDWFLNVFEQWQQENIAILGFNKLKGNKFNPAKATLTIQVVSGINWFNTKLNVRFGKKSASLKQLQKSVRNNNRFVQLDDGTLGILPAEWLRKFEHYFLAGEVVDENLLTAKINYTAINQLYTNDELDPAVKNELALYQARFNNFDTIKETNVPAQLHGQLRHYQLQGLNWLNFLDEFNFGGCLADDMGLGKSLQIIAFILSQREKLAKIKATTINNTSSNTTIQTTIPYNTPHPPLENHITPNHTTTLQNHPGITQPNTTHTLISKTAAASQANTSHTTAHSTQTTPPYLTTPAPPTTSTITHNTNLIVVPTSLIFNWQDEIAKFAPSLKRHTLYGPNRARNTENFARYEVILTSYGTLLSDITFLKSFTFNYIFLDESQNIKNPTSQRYQTVQQLQSRNKIVITGTPIENNTFDLYGQLSFACPGLFGSRQRFRDLYSTPIDKFRDTAHAVELQQKINPFILRRTKEQVAPELPDKTEMILYCEMGEAQRKVYDAHEEELRDFLNSRSDDNLPKNAMHVLKGLTKLRQICNSPILLNEEKLLGSASAKIDALMEQIDNQAGNHKILVFSQFVSMLNLIKKALEERNIPHEYLTGNTKNREQVVHSFQNNAHIRVFLISLKAGGTGLNLTEADYVYLVDPWWNPAVENQAIDRSYRIGQKKNVVAVRLICPNTVEEKMMKMQANKKDLVNDLIKTDTTVVKSLSKKELLNLLGQ